MNARRAAGIDRDVRAIRAWLVVVVAGCGDPGEPVPERLYVIAGQSNAVGGANVTGLPDAALATPEPGVTIIRRLGCETFAAPCSLELGWDVLEPHPAVLNADTRHRYHGVELTLGRALMARYGTGTVGLVQHATNGSRLADDWDPDATTGQRLYQRMIDDARAIEAETGATIEGVFWIQGNTDARQPATADAYGENLRNLIVRIRADLGDQVSVVFDQLSPDAICAYGDVVRARQAGVVNTRPLPRVHMVPTDGLPLRDATGHYTSESYVVLGEEFAAAMIDME